MRGSSAARSLAELVGPDGDERLSFDDSVMAALRGSSDLDAEEGLLRASTDSPAPPSAVLSSPPSATSPSSSSLVSFVSAATPLSATEEAEEDGRGSMVSGEAAMEGGAGPESGSGPKLKSILVPAGRRRHRRRRSLPWRRG